MAAGQQQQQVDAEAAAARAEAEAEAVALAAAADEAVALNLLESQARAEMFAANVAPVFVFGDDGRPNGDGRGDGQPGGMRLPVLAADRIAHDPFLRSAAGLDAPQHAQHARAVPLPPGYDPVIAQHELQQAVQLAQAQADAASAAVRQAAGGDAGNSMQQVALASGGFGFGFDDVAGAAVAAAAGNDDGDDAAAPPGGLAAAAVAGAALARAAAAAGVAARAAAGAAGAGPVPAEVLLEGAGAGAAPQPQWQPPPQPAAASFDWLFGGKMGQALAAAHANNPHRRTRALTANTVWALLSDVQVEVSARGGDLHGAGAGGRALMDDANARMRACMRQLIPAHTLRNAEHMLTRDEIGAITYGGGDWTNLIGGDDVVGANALLNGVLRQPPRSAPGSATVVDDPARYDGRPAVPIRPPHEGGPSTRAEQLRAAVDEWTRAAKAEWDFDSEPYRYDPNELAHLKHADRKKELAERALKQQAAAAVMAAGGGNAGGAFVNPVSRKPVHGRGGARVDHQVDADAPTPPLQEFSFPGGGFDAAAAAPDAVAAVPDFGATAIARAAAGPHAAVAPDMFTAFTMPGAVAAAAAAPLPAAFGDGDVVPAASAPAAAGAAAQPTAPPPAHFPADRHGNERPPHLAPGAVVGDLGHMGMAALAGGMNAAQQKLLLPMDDAGQELARRQRVRYKAQAEVHRALSDLHAMAKLMTASEDAHIKDELMPAFAYLLQITRPPGEFDATVSADHNAANDAKAMAYWKTVFESDSMQDVLNMACDAEHQPTDKNQGTRVEGERLQEAQLFWQMSCSAEHALLVRMASAAAPAAVAPRHLLGGANAAVMPLFAAATPVMAANNAPVGSARPAAVPAAAAVAALQPQVASAVAARPVVGVQQHQQHQQQHEQHQAALLMRELYRDRHAAYNLMQPGAGLAAPGPPVVVDAGVVALNPFAAAGAGGAGFGAAAGLGDAAAAADDAAAGFGAFGGGGFGGGFGGGDGGAAGGGGVLAAAAPAPDAAAVGEFSFAPFGADPPVITPSM